MTKVPDDRLFILLPPPIYAHWSMWYICVHKRYYGDILVRILPWFSRQYSDKLHTTPQLMGAKEKLFWPNFLSLVHCALAAELCSGGLRKVLVITFPSLYCSPLSKAILIAIPIVCPKSTKERLFFKGCYICRQKRKMFLGTWEGGK